MNIAILGHGMVGKAQQVLFPDAYIYTRHIGTKEEVNKCDIAFICIPALWNEQQQRLDTTAIEEILEWIECKYIVIKTTLNVGDTDRLRRKYNKWDIENFFFSPEFLRDAYWKKDIINADRVVIGGVESELIYNLFKNAYSKLNKSPKILLTTTEEAELIKLWTNTFLASKTSLMGQILEDYCNKLGIQTVDNPRAPMPELKNIRSMILADSRIGKSHTEYHGQWGGKCFPKDYHAIIALGKKIGADTSVLEAIWSYNERQGN